MKIGQRVMRCPVTIYDEDRERNCARKPIPGMVVYIHPEGRYHTVAFQLRGGVVKESFQGVRD
ncbi:MAG: hypothetical protein VB071_11850 [Lawsonibacter sp.]|nr:hypothetical protein [Lawsonibacter sp.]